MPPGEVDRAIDALAADYEVSGRLILRLLSQEERHPELKPRIDAGRQGHRAWLVGVFAEKLAALPPARRVATLDALVIATDVYVWKLVRVDMGRPVAAFKRVVKHMVGAAIDTK